MNLIRLAILAGAGAMLGACAGFLTWEEPPQRQIHNQPEVEPAPERPVGATDYLVRRGDTVYSIAFRNNLDYRDLAKWNGIGTDYLIHPGQVLRLRTPPQTRLVEGDIESVPTPLEGPVSASPIALNSGIPPSTAPPPGTAGRARPAPIPIPPVAMQTPMPGTGGSTLPSRPLAPSAGTSAPPAPTTGAEVAIAAPPVTAIPAESVPPPITSESGGPYKWQWPTNGVVVRGYNPTAGSKGLDFEGDIGQSVVAAAPGKVVYSGAALKGYGELVIIKHDDLRLSAYGYNRKRLVEEGQMVRGGQLIAELGLGPENKPILHFEIRERGQPVNPVPYLPAKTGVSRP